MPIESSFASSRCLPKCGKIISTCCWAPAYLQRFPEGVVLINEGELPDFLHVVVDGTVELFAGSGDRQTTIDVIYPVTTFILAAVIRDEVYLKSARTLTPAQYSDDSRVDVARRV